MANHKIRDTALFDKIIAAISKNGPLSLDTLSVMPLAILIMDITKQETLLGRLGFYNRT